MGKIGAFIDHVHEMLAAGIMGIALLFLAILTVAFSPILLAIYLAGRVFKRLVDKGVLD